MKDLTFKKSRFKQYQFIIDINNRIFILYDVEYNLFIDDYVWSAWEVHLSKPINPYTSLISENEIHEEIPYIYNIHLTYEEQHQPNDYKELIKHLETCKIIFFLENL